MAQLDLGKVTGSKLYNVSGVPEGTLGQEGDWAMDPGTGKLYEKTASGWTARGSLMGPQGETGADGAKGDTGPQGPAGKTPTLSINGSGHLIATYSD